MAATPKRRTSTKRSGKRMHAKIKKLTQYVECPYCHQPKLPHRACPNCGRL